MPLGVLMVNCTVVSHPRLSAMVTLHPPGQSPPAVGVPWPEPGCGFHVMVNGPEPPDGITVAVPSQPPPQLASVVVNPGWIGAGAAMLNATVVSQVAASVMVKV